MAFLFITLILLQNVNFYKAGECQIDNCRHCTSLSECSVCEVSRFGKTCEHKCLADYSTCSFCSDSFLKAFKSESACFGCQKHEYFSNGKCRSCPQRCISCSDSNKCDVCKEGYFGSSCQETCPKNCIRCSSYDLCTSCKDGWLGSFCQCSSSCVKEANETEWCGINGSCLKGCLDGKQGRTCHVDCPNKDNCLKCGQFSDTCLKCSPGLFGAHCDTKCGHCKPEDESAVECNNKTGECNSTCLDGFFGLRCENNCSQCLPSKDTGKIGCDVGTGICKNGCIDGYHGSNCDKRCGYCLSDDLGIIRCDDETGHCQNSCSDGYFGLKCDQKCSLNCFVSSANKTVCDKITGKCVHGCNKGWYGERCELPCSSNCSNQSCSQLSGHCNKGCVSGLYGEMCTEICNSLCVNKTCDQQSGHCENVCDNGFSGELCGNICIGKCQNNTCERHTSQCLLGCEAGFGGIFCNESILLQADFGHIVIGTVSGAAGVLIISVCVVLTWTAIRFSLCGKQFSGKNVSSTANVEPVYAEISEEPTDITVTTHFNGDSLHMDSSTNPMHGVQEPLSGTSNNICCIYESLSDRNSIPCHYVALPAINTAGNLQQKRISESDQKIDITFDDCERGYERSVNDIRNNASKKYHEHVFRRCDMNSFGTDLELRQMQLPNETFFANQDDSCDYLHPVI